MTLEEFREASWLDCTPDTSTVWKSNASVVSSINGTTNKGIKIHLILVLGNLCVELLENYWCVLSPPP